ncbi:5'-nucleotidase [Streptomyces nigra]|uniref:5'-nucleotidase n=1 Tax=Streptomyces nigra TaxID=1827580 RepID=UPI003423A963
MPPYELANRLVIGIASSALFDLAEADTVFREQGEESYRVYQEEHLDDTLSKGVAFPFIRRLLSLNDLSAPDDPLVEVIVLSRNDPDTGLRVMRSIKSHGLAISRAIFMQGRSPYRFIPALNMSLFLSANETDVREAVALGLPAGRVLGPAAADDTDDQDLRIAFDFDGVLADDSSEQVFQTGGIEGFRSHETMNAATPHDPGPLRDFLASLNRLQRREEEQRTQNPDYKIRVRVSLVTARNAPAHERAVRSLKGWGVTVNDAFFLGGIDKSAIMQVLRPHIFFDDQVSHLAGTSRSTPSVHVPFGKINEGPAPTLG